MTQRTDNSGVNASGRNGDISQSVGDTAGIRGANMNDDDSSSASNSKDEIETERGPVDPNQIMLETPYGERINKKI